jgi:hypothetical protein
MQEPFGQISANSRPAIQPIEIETITANSP